MVLDKECQHEDWLELQLTGSAFSIAVLEAEVFRATVTDELANLVEVQRLHGQDTEARLEQIVHHALLVLSLRVDDILQAHHRIVLEHSLVNTGHDLQLFVDEFGADCLIRHVLVVGRQFAIIVLDLAQHGLVQVRHRFMLDLRVVALIHKVPALSLENVCLR